MPENNQSFLKGVQYKKIDPMRFGVEIYRRRGLSL
jgi:hypothetical protein